MKNSSDITESKTQQPGFELGTHNLKIIATVVALVAIFSGLKIYTGQHRVESEIHFIERQFEAREQSLMKDMLMQCQGDVSNSEVFKHCEQKYKNELLAEHQAKLKRLQIHGYLWWLFWGGIIAFSFRSRTNNPILKQTLLFIRTVWNRVFVEGLKKLFNKLRNLK